MRSKVSSCRPAPTSSARRPSFASRAAARRGSARTSRTTARSTTGCRRVGRPSAGRLVDAPHLLRASGALPLFDEEPGQHAFLDYRRWAFESAALDLALRQAGLSLGGAVGREPSRSPSSSRWASARRRPPSASAPGFGCTQDCASSSTRTPSGPTSSSPSWPRRTQWTRSTSRGSTAARSWTRHPTPRCTAASPRGCRRVDRGPGAHRRDDTGARATPRAAHLGRGHPLRRGHRGPPLAAADGEREALAVRLGRTALRRVRLLRGAGDRRVRRRPVGARPRPRPDPAPGGALPPGHAERRRSARVQPGAARRPAGEPPRRRAARDGLPRAEGPGLPVTSCARSTVCRACRGTGRSRSAGATRALRFHVRRARSRPSRPSGRRGPRRC